MAILVFPQRSTLKPSLGTRINPGSPLATGLLRAYLLNEGGGVSVTSSAGTTGSFNGSMTWGTGPAARITTSTATNFIDCGNSSFLPTSNCTIVVGFRKTDSTNRGALLFNPNHSVAFASTPRCSAHCPFSDGTVYWDFGGSTSGSTRVSAAGLSFSNDMIFAFTTGPRGMEIWQDGILRASNAANPTRTAADGNFHIGGGVEDGTATVSDIVDYKFFYIFGRQLANSEIQQLYVDPYSIYQPQSPQRRMWVVPAAAAAGSLFTPSTLSGLGSGGSFFQNPLN